MQGVFSSSFVQLDAYQCSTRDSDCSSTFLLGPVLLFYQGKGKAEYLCELSV